MEKKYHVKLLLTNPVEKLQDVIAEVWAATDPELLLKLAHSMPRRCQAVINAKGQHTDY